MRSLQCVSLSSIAALAAMTAFAAGCSDEKGPVDPASNIATIEVVGPPTSLIASEQYVVTAQVHSASGGVLDNVVMAWRSSDDAVATVVAGTVTAHAAGTADIIAEAEGKSGKTQITVVSTQRLLSEDRYQDGGVIGFSSSRNGGELNVYVMDASGVRKVTTSPDHEQFDGWSPDGQRVAVLRFPVNVNQFTSHIVNVDGSNDILVSPGVINWAPDWLHHGTVVNGQLTLSNADGSGEHPIGSAGSAAGPWWSLDGKRIAFAFAPNVTSFADIYVANVDGSNVVNVTNSPDVSEEYASWSPDGTQLAITGLNPGAGVGSSLYVVNATGTGRMQLTSNTSSRDDYEPNWSPDGKLIAYTTATGFSYGLYLIRATGGKPVRLAPAGWVSGFGHWSPDGKRLAFTAISEAGSRQNIFVTTLDRRTITQLTRNMADNLGPFFRPN